MQKIKIQTKTLLPDGCYIDKDDLIIEAFGNLDELQSVLGMLNAKLNHPVLTRIQAELAKSYGELPLISTRTEHCSVPTSAATSVALEKKQTREKAFCSPPIFSPLTSERERRRDFKHYLAQLEQDIQLLSAALPKIADFIMPGKNFNEALCHFARAVTRRTERRLISLSRYHPIDPSLLAYFNQLSRFLFLLSRTL